MPASLTGSMLFYPILMPLLGVLCASFGSLGTLLYYGIPLLSLINIPWR